MAKIKKAKRLSKEQFLEYWGRMKRRKKLVMRPISYEHTGSTFDQDGIRLTGSRVFIDAILSRLTELQAYEASETRLGVSYQQATDKETRQPIPDAWTCYIQVRERGDQAKMANAFVEAITGKSPVR